MKCFYCGRETDKFLCDNCINEQVLINIFPQLLNTKVENCNNPYILEYSKTLNEFKEIRNCIPAILDMFDLSINNFYYCRYYKLTNNPLFEEKAIDYLNLYDQFDIKKQRILYDLLNFYLRNDYYKPKKWCDVIVNNDNLFIELYDIASEYYSMVGDYDLSEKCIEYGKSKLKSNDYLFSNRENMIKSFDKIESSLERYKNGKPYWPKTEERRLQIKNIYDKKGINYNYSVNISYHRNRDSRRIKASEFIADNEWYDDIPSNYISFYCKGEYSTNTVITMYEIGALKVSNGKIIGKFYDIVKPWEDSKIKEKAIKDLNITMADMNNADSVKVAMDKFIDFIGEELLVSTEGLGVQKSILTRALRYAFYKELKNPIADILDYAASKDSKFDFENNTRDYLINYFKLDDDRDSLSRAITNYRIVEKLRNFKE